MSRIRFTVVTSQDHLAEVVQQGGGACLGRDPAADRVRTTSAATDAATERSQSSPGLQPVGGQRQQTSAADGRGQGQREQFAAYPAAPRRRGPR